jgi:hypothetical protein
MKERDNLIGCSSRTSKYKSPALEVPSGSGISSGCCMRTLWEREFMKNHEYGYFSLIYCGIPWGALDLCQVK